MLSGAPGRVPGMETTFRVHKKGKPRRPLWDRFWEQVLLQKTTDGCWEWIGAKQPSGYGRIGSGGDGGKVLMAHRVAYEFMVGPIPPGLQIDHLCRNKSCVNPAHLEAVTHRENMIRAGMLKRIPFCKRGHPRTPENLRIQYYPDGTVKGRSCRHCERIVKGYKTPRKPPYTFE